MPILNTRNNKISSQNGILKDLQPLKNEIKKLTLAIVECKGNISKIKRDLDAFAEVKNKLDTFISYTDKKRVNNCIKDLTNIKKQINMSKTSKIFKEITSIKERVGSVEDLEERLNKLENIVDSLFEDKETSSEEEIAFAVFGNLRFSFVPIRF